MSVSKIRYFTPALFFVVIGGAAAFIIYLSTSHSPPVDFLSLTGIPMQNLIMIILGASIPVLILEYLIFAIPLAGGFLFINRVIKAASYEMNIMNIGREFSGRHMIRRTAAPALFSVAFSNNQMIRNFILGFVTITIPDEYQFMPEATLALMSALVFMPIALLIFMPTWVLNDSGIVTHLKENKLSVRQCPDTQGVGRWVSAIFGGYALIAFPINMFTTHFYEPYVIPSLIPTAVDLVNIFLLTIGLPLFVMAFILPVVAFNERSQRRVRLRIAAIATRLGANIIRRERIEKAQRIVREGILTEEAGREIVSSAKIMNVARNEKKEKEIVSSRKTISKKTTKIKKKKKK
ncbi:MAG: hypothetical protein ACFFEF_08230 [Candidatus Thorarchaeota archaeon]